MRSGDNPNVTLAFLGLALVAVGFVKALTGQLSRDDGYSRRARLFGAVPLSLDELEEDADKLLEAQKQGGDVFLMCDQFNRECQLAGLYPDVLLLGRAMR